MTEPLTITGSSCCLMPNGSLRLRHNGQLPTETQWTLCQFTIILAFVMLHSTNMPLFTDLWIIQLKQNAVTHFWSKSHHQGEEASSSHCVLPSNEDKSFPPQRDLRLTVRIKPQNRKSLKNTTIHIFELNSTPNAEEHAAATWLPILQGFDLCTW